MKAEEIILQRVHDFMKIPIEEIRKPLNDFELTTVDGYLRLTWICK